MDAPFGRTRVSAVGWSDDDERSAHNLAEQRLARVTERLHSGETRRDRYAYDDGRPLQEPVLERIEYGGQVIAVLTRTGYGSVILNTDKALFIDVDFEHVPPPPRGFLGTLFGKKQDPVTEAVDAVKEAAKHFPDWVFQIYRTYAGLRLLLLNDALEGFAPSQLRILEQFPCDPMYRKLCASQRSYRARLTPKPWRVGLRRPPTRFPFSKPDDEAQFESWLSRYEAECRSYACCEKLDLVGLGHTHPTVSRIVEIHDKIAIHRGAPLA